MHTINNVTKKVFNQYQCRWQPRCYENRISTPLCTCSEPCLGGVSPTKNKHSVRATFKPHEISDLLLVTHWHVQSLQPDVAQSNHGVGVIFGSRTLQNALKLLLPRSPLLFGKMEVSNQRPCIWMILNTTSTWSSFQSSSAITPHLVDLQSFFEPIGGFVDLTTISGHTSETKVAWKALDVHWYCKDNQPLSVMLGLKVEGLESASKSRGVSRVV